MIKFILKIKSKTIIILTAGYIITWLYYNMCFDYYVLW